MPEGDTIHQLATNLRPHLVGQPLLHARAFGRGELDEWQGRVVEQVEAVGKHMLIHVADAPSARIHLRMNGFWRWYPADANWQGPTQNAALVLVTAAHAFACFRTRDIEWLERRRLAADTRLAALGPDLSVELVWPAELAARARRYLDPSTPLVDVLLDQRVANGIGNVFKSEALFVCRHHPETTLAHADDSALGHLLAVAARMLRDNRTRFPRRTRPNDDGPDLWVYGRADAVCLRCCARVRSAFVGTPARITYWCPQCQSTDSSP